MKKLLSLLFVFTLVACGGGDEMWYDADCFEIIQKGACIKPDDESYYFFIIRGNDERTGPLTCPIRDDPQDYLLGMDFGEIRGTQMRVRREQYYSYSNGDTFCKEDIY